MSKLDTLKDAIREALPRLDVMLAWGTGPDALHAAPLFIRTEADLDRMVLGPTCVHNLARYLTDLRGQKVGIVAKGCDSRTIVELIQENLIDRDEITVFGLSCSGVVSPAEVLRLAGCGHADAISMDGDNVTVTCGAETHVLRREQVLAEKCRSCAYPDALLADKFIGERSGAVDAPLTPGRTLAMLEDMDEPARFAFWEEQMSRCIRCYACRNACPLCVCRDQCAAQTRDPHWVTQEDHPREKLMFQIMHTLHTAGRCTECGECERACPMDIPILALRQKMNREINRLFDYAAGTDTTATPPLLDFREEEPTIKERSW